MHFLNDVANDVESTQKLKITSLSLVWGVKQWVNWLIEYQVRVFWYQVYQARLWERTLNCSASLAKSTSVLKALPGKFDIKRHRPSFLYLLFLSKHLEEGRHITVISIKQLNFMPLFQSVTTWHDIEMVGECLLISSLAGKALRTLVDIARLAERFHMRSQSRAWQTWYQKTRTCILFISLPIVEHSLN